MQEVMSFLGEEKWRKKERIICIIQKKVVILHRRECKQKHKRPIYNGTIRLEAA